MARVYLGVGSNIDRERYIGSALIALREAFGELVISPVYESEAIGFQGDPFFNLVVGVQTELPVALLQQTIKQIEDANGRERNGPKFSSRTLDIDILTYDDCVGVVDGVQLPRDEIVKNAFVLLPLSNIAGDELHPELKQTYQSLWDQYDQTSQSLRPVPFSLSV